MDKDFILKAESPTNFAAFCLTMRKLKDNPKHIVHNTVFLDATCSGVQHFAAMVLDLELSGYVNLVNTNENVNDFYSALIPKINKAINDSWKEEINTFKFKEISLTRDLLKKVIMTKSYNVTTFGVTEQLKSKFEKVAKTINHKGKEIIVYDYKVPTKKNDYVLLNRIEVEKLADIINNNIFNQFPILHSIYKYLTDLAKIYMKIGITLSWSTPNGLQLVQGYNSSKIQKIKINFLGKNRTAVLRKWTDKKDTRREVQAIIPNIIHSLDASHLILIINKWNSFILPIHDCFGTHPNDMIHLAELVRETFVYLYSSENFLKRIDEKFRQNLIDYKVNTIVKDGVEVVVIPKNKNRNCYIPLPILPKTGDLNLNDILTKGKNMIT
jgi:DNA-directed RNA polymerase, mitochondrial